MNVWPTVPTGVYSGYLVAETAPPGLETIDAPAPAGEVAINWLNIFYAVECAMFGGLSVFIWYRLVRDAWELELENLDGDATLEPAP